MRIAKEGYPLILTAAALTILAFLTAWQGVGTVLGLATLAVAAFFRDPERNVPTGEGLIVSPADGRVVHVAEAQGDPAFGDAVTLVSIFLSPLDVHINRMPVAGRIDDVRYQAGKFLAAYKEEASQRNEQNALKIVDDQGRCLGVVQVAGVLARRIVCRVRRGDSLARGDRFGLIMFGSRTDLYLPKGCRIQVVEGQKVKGGETILGSFV
ncbi:MAG TPA: phosphatidylserine decarboxylase family protein [Candidatus Binatia bacterium]|jgi:phosphatidylserine decarboxylase|nr:phosphatidylserine decarboxylase family protein [Candidatus Binatia bacterium]